MGLQLSLKTGLSLAERIVIVSVSCSNTRPKNKVCNVLILQQWYLSTVSIHPGIDVQQPLSNCISMLDRTDMEHTADISCTECSPYHWRFFTVKTQIWKFYWSLLIIPFTFFRNDSYIIICWFHGKTRLKRPSIYTDFQSCLKNI